MIDNKTKKIAVLVLVLGAMIELFAGILYGKREQWFMFGLSLTVCLMATIVYVAILLACKIDSHFNQLQRLLKDQHQMEKQEKVNEQDADKSVEE